MTATLVILPVHGLPVACFRSRARARRVPGACADRAFPGRAVRYLAGEAGIRQFLDIGTGIPAAGNTHQVAQAIAPESRVVCVDYDPVVLAHARTLLTSHQAGAIAPGAADARKTIMWCAVGRKP